MLVCRRILGVWAASLGVWWREFRQKIRKKLAGMVKLPYQRPHRALLCCSQIQEYFMPTFRSSLSLNSIKETSKRRRLAVITAYDYPTAKVLDGCQLDFILVGDSLGMVALGFEDTTWVTMEHMLHHTAAVARGVRKTPVVADLPFGSYLTAADAVRQAKRLIMAGADGVKLEGGKEVLPQIEALISEGVQVVGHLGMLPQRVREEGGYRRKGRSEEQAKELVESAMLLDSAGVTALVIESVVSTVAGRITEGVNCPTIGIGSGGASCDGEVAVVTDVVGSFPWFVPPFAKAEADFAGLLGEAVGRYRQRVYADRSDSDDTVSQLA